MLFATRVPRLGKLALSYQLHLGSGSFGPPLLYLHAYPLCAYHRPD